MTEEEARSTLDVPRETMERLEQFATLLRDENQRQNLHVVSEDLQQLGSPPLLPARGRVAGEYQRAVHACQ
jgi:heme oxygenase